MFSSQQHHWSRQRYKSNLIDSHQEHHHQRISDSDTSASSSETYHYYHSIMMNDDGLLITPASSNKRSLTDHLVDYVKKSKRLVPCKILSPIKKSKEPITAPSKRGSLCIAYSIGNDDHTQNSILTLHGKQIVCFVKKILMRARQLSFEHPDTRSLNTYVQVKYLDYEQNSKTVAKTTSPVYDQTFSIPVQNNNLSTLSKRLTISVYNQSETNKK
ncbi:unnamed protein product [Adineta ricciae]|uniref:C2 domain-containing protein n=2 Tax=Adineta ricciae TaxID=249248 RepID=A0A815EFL1_ADIRI|nr:unnamed protein product [Adineta ricciae]